MFVFYVCFRHVWILSALLFCSLPSVYASSHSSSAQSISDSSSGSSSDSSSDVSSNSESSLSIECSPLEQAIGAGSLDVASFLADASLTSLSGQLSIFRQQVSTGVITDVTEIEAFVRQLRRSVRNLFDECDLNFRLIKAAFNNLLQELNDGSFQFFSSKLLDVSACVMLIVINFVIINHALLQSKSLF